TLPLVIEQGPGYCELVPEQPGTHAGPELIQIPLRRNLGRMGEASAGAPSQALKLARWRERPESRPLTKTGERHQRQGRVQLPSQPRAVDQGQATYSLTAVVQCHLNGGQSPQRMPDDHRALNLDRVLEIGHERSIPSRHVFPCHQVRFPGTRQVGSQDTESLGESGDDPAPRQGAFSPAMEQDQRDVLARACRWPGREIVNAQVIDPYRAA